MFSSLAACDAPVDVPGAKVALYLHQQADISAMRRMESGHVALPGGNGDTFRTTMGVLADKPGAGKSFSMLSHVASRPTVSEESMLTRNVSYYCNRLQETLVTRFSKPLRTNMFVVPRHVLRQWTKYATDMAGIDPEDLAVWTKVGDVEYAALTQDRYRYVLLTENAYKSLLGYDVGELLLQRLIIDEADSIYVASFYHVEAHFTWFITGTPSDLVNGRSRTPGLNKLFNRCYPRRWEHIVVKSTDAFVEQSMRLPPYSERVARADAVAMMGAVREFVTSDVMDAINACDIGSAIARVGCSKVETEDGVVAAVTAKMRTDVETMIQAMASAPPSAVQSICTKVAEMERKMESIIARVREADCCPISMDSIRVKAVVPCCQNTFEFANIIRALQRSGKCPLCAQPLAASGLVVVQRSGPEPPPAPRSKADVVREELAAILADADAKVLMFSDFGMDSFAEGLGAMGVAWKEVKGNVFVIDKAVREFNEGKTRVLLLNAAHFGAGINIQCATHIVTMHAMQPDRYRQLVGRAQRPGRAGPLSVINIRYDHEL